MKRTKLEKQLAKEKAKVERKKRKVETKIANDEFNNANAIDKLEENLNISNYYFSSDNLLRLVTPYSFTHGVYAKTRWEKKEICDMIMNEFHYKTMDEIIVRIEKGLVKVNNENVTKDYVIKGNDFISHTIHRHELPILNIPIEIVHEDNEKLVINKPSSIPVHPCGRYFLNSIVYILAKEMNYRNLRVVHRLDRLTSGLLILSKTYTASSTLSELISGRNVVKYYLASVRGHFPQQLKKEKQFSMEFDKINEENSMNFKSIVVDCHVPLGNISPKFGIRSIVPETNGGQFAHSTFVLVDYCSKTDTSIVLCQLHTGRTHQIRVHLQYLGHPIWNDPLYATAAWGPEMGFMARYGKSLDELVNDVENEHKSDLFVTGNYNDAPITTTTIHESQTSSDSNNHVMPPSDPDCPDCVHGIRIPSVESLYICLHSLRYVTPSWDFTAPLPSWCKHVDSVNFDALENSSNVRLVVKRDVNKE